MAKKFNSKRKGGKVKEDTDAKTTKATSSGGSQLYMYVNSEQSLKDSASLAFSDVLGLAEDMSEINIDSSASVGVTVNDAGVNTLPGIVSMLWTPAIGTCEKNADTPINVAALNSYSYVRHANSGHSNYDHTDFIMVILAIANFFAWLGGLIRVYGVMSVFNQRNRYQARALVTAMGFDYDDLVMHINDLRAFINHKIAEASVLWIPNTMPFVSRWFTMNSYVYMDSESPKAQLYLFRMKRVYKFVNKTSTEGSMLKVQEVNTMTFNEIVTFTNDLMSPLISDEDVGIMCGDILKAFGADKIYGLSQIPDEYVNLPIYDQEMLMQIHNATIHPQYGPGVGLTDIKQDLTSDPGFIYQDYTMNAEEPAFAGICGRRYFDLQGFEHDPSIVMIATRLQAISKLQKVNATQVRMIPYLHGTEFINGAYVYANPNVSGNTLAFTTYMQADNETRLNNVAKVAAALSKFDWAPMVYACSGTMADSQLALEYKYLFGEIENFTTLGAPELAKMHRTAVYTELGIPYI